MTLRVLIIGGYGTFGARLIRRLLGESRLHLIVAGRSLEKARQFAEGLDARASVEALALDRDADLSAVFAAASPDVVVDASGPFQTYTGDTYRVVRAALGANAHYLDLADDPDFVAGIRQFDADARERGLIVLSGVSSCPALTGAAFRRLTRDMRSVDEVIAGIAPSPYAGVGPSVIRAIAEYAGTPVAIRRNGERATAYPFTETRRRTIGPPGTLPLRSLKYSLVDVPELTLLEELEPAPANVWFGAAPVPAVYHAMFRFLARLVRWKLLRSLSVIAGAMIFVMRHFSWGEHRGGMFVTCRGKDDNARVSDRTWHLLTEGNIGPLTPVLACVAIVGKLLSGNPPAPGARPAHCEVELEDFEPLLKELGAQFGERDTPDESAPVFKRILQSAWGSIPAQIREAHEVHGRLMLKGRAAIIRGRSIFARAIGWVFGFPVTGDQVAVTVDMTTNGKTETWTRNFDGQRFGSELSVGSGRWEGLIVERFGLVRVGIALVVDGRRLRYVIRRWSLAGIPMPFALRPRGDTFEFVEDGRFNFNVEIALPIVGHIVTYRGWLEPHAAAERANPA